ncbi:MAG: hypothetical protein SFU98_14910 [Leptospiraceae bacterium]|nr:hypothetical protein [Leptospiraceae bacterium]
MEDVVEELIYEYWDCPKCGNKGIRGDEYKCSSCGFPRDDSIKFYRKEVEEKVTDTNQAEKFVKGPDWVCSFCNSLNFQDDQNCKGCGASKSDSEKNYFENLKEKEEKEAKKANKAVEAVKEEPKTPVWKKIAFAVSGFFVLLLGICFYGLSSHKVNYKVTKVNWVRAIAIERYAWSNRSDWSDSMVGDGIVEISRTQSIRSYEKRQVGTTTESYTDTERYQSGTKRECSTSYESTGSGASKKKTSCSNVPTYSSRNVRKTRTVPVYKDFPIYGTKVNYRSKMYQLLGYRVKQGTDNNPEFPNPRLGTGEEGKPDKETERVESLQVTLVKVNKDDSGEESLEIVAKENEFKTKYLKDALVEMNVTNFGFIDFKNGEEKLDRAKYDDKFKPIFARSLGE